MNYLVTGHRRNDGWPFAGEVIAGTGDAAAAMVRRWGVEPEFVQDIGTGRVEFRVDDSEGDGDDDGGEDDVAPPGVWRGPAMSAEPTLS
jgi:hypothetical protein